MSIQRFIYPEIWQDEDFIRLDHASRLMFIGLITLADDEGRIRCNTSFIRNGIYPCDDITLDEIRSILGRVLAGCRHLILYEVDTLLYLQFENWGKYQHPKYVKESKFPPIEKGSILKSLPETTPNPGQTRTESGPNPDATRTMGSDRVLIGLGSNLGTNTECGLPKKANAHEMEIKEIIEYFNAKLGTRYRPTSKDTIEHINARLKEGWSLDDFRTVIDNKVDEWSSDPKTAGWLRPKTLFSGNFESYLNRVKPISKGLKTYNTLKNLDLTQGGIHAITGSVQTGDGNTSRSLPARTIDGYAENVLPNPPVQSRR